MCSTNSILTSKAFSPYDYIQDNCVLGQQIGQKVYHFKLLVEGDNCGIHLTRQMQLGGDLENTWMMFDHVKRVQGWMTMACHVYDPIYYKVMSIAIYNM
jgi:hypothetical protein